MGEENGNTIGELVSQIQRHDQLIWESAQTVIQAQHQNRKPRRRKMGEQLVASRQDFLFIRRFFDDGSNEILFISSKLTGYYEVYTLKLNGWEGEEIFGIFFQDQNVWVTGNKRRLKASYLFERFVESAGEFLPVASHALIGKILYDHFANQIAQTENYAEVSAHAGWNNENFLHHDNFLFRKNRDFLELPVMKKRFPIIPLKREHVNIYFAEIKNIMDWKNCMIIALYPFVGILASIFNSFGGPVDFCLNFIEMDTNLRRRICSWLKIFNRNILLPFSLNVNMVDLDKMLYESNDEVLICDANSTDLDSLYTKNKIKKM